MSKSLHLKKHKIIYPKRLRGNFTVYIYIWKMQMIENPLAVEKWANPRVCRTIYSMRRISLFHAIGWSFFKIYWKPPCCRKMSKSAGVPDNLFHEANFVILNGFKFFTRNNFFVYQQNAHFHFWCFEILEFGEKFSLSNINIFTFR